MKHKIIFIFLALIVSTVMNAQIQSIEDILLSIESNNKQLQANKQETISQKLEAKTDNNLSDPSVSYSYLWGKDNESISELEVTQSFDFPSLYVTRNRMNKLKFGAFDSQAEALRRDLLLQAKEVCLDIILLRQQKKILDERLNNALILSELYGQRLKAGDATIIETNKINLELLNVKTEATLNETSLRNKLKELITLNGNKEIIFEGTEYPVVIFPLDYESLRNEIITSDMSLYALDREAAASQVEVSLNKSQWIPKLELGYRRNTESGMPFNGVTAGISIPLFENRNKVKQAKAKNLNLTFQKENKLLEIESELVQQYQEAQSLQTTMEAYESTFASQSDLLVLKEALTGGQISIIDYFVEVSVVYQSKQNYLQLKNQYHKAMAKIYKNRL